MPRGDQPRAAPDPPPGGRIGDATHQSIRPKCFQDKPQTTGVPKRHPRVGRVPQLFMIHARRGSARSGLKLSPREFPRRPSPLPPGGRIGDAARRTSQPKCFRDKPQTTSGVMRYPALRAFEAETLHRSVSGAPLTPGSGASLIAQDPRPPGLRPFAPRSVHWTARRCADRPSPRHHPCRSDQHGADPA
jgi:hypothetical protein